MANLPIHTSLSRSILIKSYSVQLQPTKTKQNQIGEVVGLGVHCTNYSWISIDQLRLVWIGGWVSWAQELLNTA
jgi:hypothetical protein